MSFSKDFIWGAAASYQIEGAAFEDGRGLSVWDTFSHTDGKVKNKNNGDVACDHYHRFHEDVQLMKEMGLKAYRFSISWSRILPEGIGKVNQAGINFYSDLVDQLLEAGIDIRGYFAWSLLDNFEWSEGYNERFGLIYMDYETLKRTPKDSYYWYRDVIATNSENL